MSPEAEIKKRGGAKRYRTKKLDGKYIHIAVVPKAGPSGGHTIAGPVHEKKKTGSYPGGFRKRRYHG